MAKIIQFPVKICDEIVTENPVLEHKSGTYFYCPDAKEPRPDFCEMDSCYSKDGEHYYIDTYIPLEGRGISMVDKTRSGMYTYRVTNNAYSKLEKQYAIAMKTFLD